MRKNKEMKIKSTLNNSTSISFRLTKSNFSYFSNSTNFSKSCVSFSPLKLLKNTKNELNHRLPLISGEDGRRGCTEIGIWLNACPPKRTRRRMDPMADKYPSLSPFAYCANNPVILVDPDGREIDGWELNFRTGELAWKNNSGGDNLQKVDVVDNGKNLFSFDLNTNKEQMKEYQNASNDFSLVGIGDYAEASASYGYGFAASVGEFNMFSEPDKTFQFTDAGSYNGYDAGIGAGAMLIFGPKDMKGKDLEGWSVSLTGGINVIEGGIHTSASRDGSPTWNYAVVTVGLAASISGGGISFSHTTVKEKPKNSGYWDRPHPHCFAAGTKIYTLNGFVDIQDLNIGDTLFAYNFISNDVEFSIITKKTHVRL